MWKTIKKYLTDKNWGLKIVSLIAAVVLWLAVVNLDNPEITKTFTVPVNITGEELLEQIEKVYEVVGNTNLATIYVTGERSLVDSLYVSDFIATADLNQIIDIQENGNQKLVPIEVSVRKNADKLNITQKTSNLKISLEDLSSDQTYVAVDTFGTVAEGYAIGEVTVSPNLVTISGPQSLVSKINRVVANVNVSGLYEDCTINVPLTLYDANGDVIESSQIKLSQTSVTASVQVLGTKEVPIRCETTGEPADGYVFEHLEYAPETIVVKGAPALLNNIQEIVIPGDAISLEGARADVENSIDINPYLEAGISLVNSEEGRIAVKAVIVALQSKTLELLMEDIQILNLPEKYEVTFGNAKVLIPVRGRSEDMEELTVDQLSASVNVEDLEPGTHVVEVDITLDEKFEITRTTTIRLSIKEIEEPVDDPQSGEPNTGDQNNNEDEPEIGEGTGEDSGEDSGSGSGNDTHPEEKPENGEVTGGNNG